MKLTFLRTVLNYVLIFLIFTLVRSPIAMFLIGFAAGGATFYFYPDQAFHIMDSAKELLKEFLLTTETPAQ